MDEFLIYLVWKFPGIWISKIYGNDRGTYEQQLGIKPSVRRKCRSRWPEGGLTRRKFFYFETCALGLGFKELLGKWVKLKRKSIWIQWKWWNSRTSCMNQGYFFKTFYKILSQGILQGKLCINSTVGPVPCSLWRWGLQGEVKGRTGSAPADQIEGARGPCEGLAGALLKVRGLL